MSVTARETELSPELRRQTNKQTKRPEPGTVIKQLSDRRHAELVTPQDPDLLDLSQCVPGTRGGTPGVSSPTC